MISESTFFYVVPYDRAFVRSAEAPFITLLIWAQSAGAALRALDQIIELDDGAELYHPPTEMLLSSGAVDYATILEEGHKRRDASTFEHASYRSPDGVFVQRTISVGNQFEFDFRSREDRKNEKPYAISFQSKRVS